MRRPAGTELSAQKCEAVLISHYRSLLEDIGSVVTLSVNNVLQAAPLFVVRLISWSQTGTELELCGDSTDLWPAQTDVSLMSVPRPRLSGAPHLLCAFEAQHSGQNNHGGNR